MGHRTIVSMFAMPCRFPQAKCRVPGQPIICQRNLQSTSLVTKRFTIRHLPAIQCISQPVQIGMLFGALSLSGL